MISRLGLGRARVEDELRAVGFAPRPRVVVRGRGEPRGGLEAARGLAGPARAREGVGEELVRVRAELRVSRRPRAALEVRDGLFRVLDLGEEKGAKFPNAPISTRFG